MLSFCPSQAVRRMSHAALPAPLSQLHDGIDRFFLDRIGIRVLIGHYLDLHELKEGGYPEYPENPRPEVPATATQISNPSALPSPNIRRPLARESFAAAGCDYSLL